MSHIHFIGGEKGGVGKSLLARVLAQHFIDRSQPFIGFDTDRSHGALLRYYADYAAPLPLDAHDSLDPVIEAATAEPGRRVLVDLAAQTQGPLLRWLDDASVPALATELGLRLCGVAPADLATIPTLTDSLTVRALRGSGSPAEAAALAVARRHGGPRAALLQPRAVSADRLATCALASLAPPSRTRP